MLRATAQFLLGGAACLLVCELLFRVLPVSTSTMTGYYFDSNILTYPAHHEWRVATGWDLRNPQTLHSNNVGFVSEHDFQRDESAIALIGDSYIESSMLDASDRPGTQLERALGGTKRVFAMGSPGTSLLDYAERIRYAHEQFGTRDFALLMARGDVRQSLCGSGNIDSPCLNPRSLAAQTERRPQPSLAKRTFRHSALAQYLAGQLKVDPARLLRGFFPSASTAHRVPVPEEQTLRQFDAVIETFFRRVEPHVTGRLVVVVDTDRTQLQAGRDVDDIERERFIARAHAAGAIVVDAEPIYRGHFARSSLSLDVGPYDGHLNPLGVGLLMNAMADALRK